MAKYNPAKSPVRSNHRTILSELRYELQLMYYRYQVMSGIYIMTPVEKLIFNAIILSLFSLLVWSTWYYLPAAVRLPLQRSKFYMTGVQIKPNMTAIIMDHVDEAAASLLNTADAVVKMESAASPTI